MQKNKIDVVKAVCNSAARKLMVLWLAAAANGVGNAGNLSLVATAQSNENDKYIFTPTPYIRLTQNGVTVENDSPLENYTYHGAVLNGIERVGIVNGNNFVSLTNDEGRVETYGNLDVGVFDNEEGGNGGDNYIMRRGTTYMYNPSSLQMRHDNIPARLENGTSFTIRSTASDTLRNLMNAMDPEAVRRACEDFLTNHQPTHSYCRATAPARQEREVREERGIHEETNYTTTTSQNAGYFGGMLNPLNWRFFGGSSN